MASAGDEITINVSYGPEQREVPDCTGLSYGECVQKLKAAGFGKYKQTEQASTPEQKDKVLSTIPPANQTSAITNEIAVVVGNGPQTAAVPVIAADDGCGRADPHRVGFLEVHPGPVDSTEPSGQVVGSTRQPAGRAQDTVIQMQVSKATSS